MNDACCRSCGAAGLETVLSLGCTPLANDLREAPGDPEETWPLELAVCTECALAQLTVTVPPERLFSDYAYHSSFSDTMLAHAAELAARVGKARRLGPRSLVVELASNDGYLLRHYRAAGVKVLGIDPAANVVEVARERGVPTLCEFFGAELAERLREEGLEADVVHAHNVLAHVADLNGFVAGIARLLKVTGRAVVEVPYVGDLLDGCEFDTIYHEHLCYFSATALDRLWSRHGLELVDVARVPIHGGSLQQWVALAGESKRSPSVGALLRAEAAAGLDGPEAYRGFATRVEGVRDRLVALLRELKAGGARLAAYGASAKGATLLSYAGVGRDLLDYVVDRSPYKQGRYTPGGGLPIHPPERLAIDVPDYVLLLTWNFADEIFEQQAEYRRRGGRFIVPIPEPRVV